jgi:hypothetical protein
VYAPAQQQYPAGAYPTPGYPGYPAPYGQNPSRRGLWIALGIVALLLVGGGITATVVLVGTNDDPLAGPSASTGPTTAVTTPPGVTKLTLNAPQNLAGLTKSTEASLQQTADNLVNEIKAEIDGETGAVASFYNDPQAPGKRVLFVGVTADIVSPTAELDQSFVSLNDTGLNIKNIADVSPGPLGGKAKCGLGKTGDVGLAVCIWADNESLGMVVFYNRTVAESTDLFVKIRGEASTRS